LKSLDEYLCDAERAHGHLCTARFWVCSASQKLGIRDPRDNDRKRLFDNFCGN